MTLDDLNMTNYPPMEGGSDTPEDDASRPPLPSEESTDLPPDILPAGPADSPPAAAPAQAPPPLPEAEALDPSPVPAPGIAVPDANPADPSAMGEPAGPVETEPMPASRPQRATGSSASLGDVLRGNMLLPVLLIGGVIGVYLLSLTGGPAIASAEQKQTELRVDTMLTALAADPTNGKRAEEVVRSFYCDARQRQVPRKDLRANPFVFVIAGDSSDPGAKPSRREHILRVEELKEARLMAQELRLQSVMQGPQGSTAVISDKLVQQGQVINGWTVETIEPRRVILKWRDYTHELKLKR